jgi:hypothetical protein
MVQDGLIELMEKVAVGKPGNTLMVEPEVYHILKRRSIWGRIKAFLEAIIGMLQ